MVKGFWGQFDTANTTSFPDSSCEPLFVLAPMEDVTDAAFRAMFARYSGRQHADSVMSAVWTEFTSADALAHELGRDRVSHRLIYDHSVEKPIVAQIFGARPQNIEIAAKHCAELGFDGIDLNMGCPEKNIQKQGACAALIKTPALALETIAAARCGAEALGGDKCVPVSVKTRIGYNAVSIDSEDGWIRLLLEQKLPVLTVHLRTKKEMSDVPAHWELMPSIVKLRDEISPQTLIIGNGDVQSVAHGRELCSQTGCDGVMVGRGAFGNPWFFREHHTPTLREKLEALARQTELFDQMFLQKPADAPDDWYRIKNFAIMKKHFKAYVQGFDGASTVRVRLMECQSADEVSAVIADVLKNMG